MTEFGGSKSELISILDELEEAHLIKRLNGSQRILMLWPFSNIPTPFLDIVEGGRSYYANCAWDSFGIHAALRKPVKIESYCHHCNVPITLLLRDEKLVEREPKGVTVFFSKRAYEWWDNIVDTCSNNMNFFSSNEHLSNWNSEHPEKEGEQVSLEQLISMSRYFYGNRLDLDYTRPSRDAINNFFRSIGLTSNFWKI